MAVRTAVVGCGNAGHVHAKGFDTLLMILM
jgi:hypothetical protein